MAEEHDEQQQLEATSAPADASDDAARDTTAPDEVTEQTPAGEPLDGPQTASAPADDEDGDEPLTRPGMKWCVLRVASNREDMVRETLERKVKIEGLEDAIGRILVPTEKRPAPRGRGKQKVVNRKMYPGYVFIEIKLEEDGSIDEKAWFTVKETTGVGDFIGAGGKPSPMADEDVEKMLAQVTKAKEGAPVAVEFAKSDQVKIKEGAFENFEGIVDEVLPDKGLVRVVVTIFGRATPVELEYWQVEKM